MGRLLRVLLADDSEDDALLILRELRRGGFEPESVRVDTPEGFQQALGDHRWDMVITDHNMPRFSSTAALEAVRGFDPDLPVIIVSGDIGEDIAVTAMRSGASDYIMKDNLARLVPAINRELREAENRRAHRQAENMIRHLAFHDALTGLTNRHEFEHRLRHAVESARIDRVEHGLLYIDLDQFKVVNDTCGHIAGDELLKQLAVVLRRPIRENDVLARLGGDEFGVLLESCRIDRASEIAEKILKSVKEFRFSWRDKSFTVGASIGLVMITEHDQNVSEILSAADVACYSAKDMGRNRINIYRADDRDMAKRRGEMEWVARINQALEQNRLVLFSQKIIPVCDISAPPHMEFLVRLTGEGGEILPGAFIPAAERYNLMPAVDRWVVNAAFSYVSALMAKTGGAHFGTAFVNLSGSSLGDSDLHTYILEKLREYKIPARRICFEITETAAISNMTTAISFIEKVREYGCFCALDDFGAGLSSFSYLKAIPVDFLKIDGEFIRDMEADPMNGAIVSAINQVAHTAKLKTIGEFVESPQTLKILQQIGVDYAQGYGIEKPKPLVAP